MLRVPQESRVDADGLEICVFEWAGEGRPVFLAHATGFHARCWDRVVEHLPGRRCIALDFRGHGRSSKPPPPYVWMRFGDDVTAVCRALGIRDAIAVGHSKGGHAVTRAAALVPGTFAALLLVDPVIMPQAMYAAPPRIGEHFAARRRDAWASPEEMFERFRGREPFSRWDAAVLRDYCDYGLLPAAEGGYLLACPPAIEAAVYAGAAGSDIYEEIAAVDVPVRVLRARQRTGEGAMDMSGSPTNPELAGHFRKGEDVYLPQYSHFMPMEDPAFVAAQVLELEERLAP